MRLRQAKKIMYSINSGRPVRNTTWRKAAQKYLKNDDKTLKYLRVLMSKFDIEVIYECPSR